MGKSNESVVTLEDSWGSNNDGEGSGLDADTLDGISSIGFAKVSAELDINAMITAGMYSGTTTNTPVGANPESSITVCRGTGSNTVSQTLVDLNGKIFVRNGILAAEVPAWKDWLQHGAMEFDGSILTIYL